MCKSVFFLTCHQLSGLNFTVDDFHKCEQMWTNVRRDCTVCLTANTAITFRVPTNAVVALTTSSTAVAAYTVGTYQNHTINKLCYCDRLLTGFGGPF